MTVIRRSSATGASGQTPALIAIFTIFVVLLIYLATVTDDVVVGSSSNPAAPHKTSSLRHSVVKKRQQLKHALHSLTENHMPMRLLKLRENSEIVGERLGEIRAGTETVEEVLHGASGGNARGDASDKPPMELNEIREYLEKWIHNLHEVLVTAKHESHFGIWQAYHDLTVKTLYLWDREYLERMPERREDGTIFLSIATYRDENCLNTVKWAFEKAKHPEKLYVGMVQQNCHKDCQSGILAGGKTEVRDDAMRACHQYMWICLPF